MAAPWTDLERTTVREVRQKREGQTPCDSTYKWNLKSDTNELIYETDSQTQKTNLGYQREREWGREK